MLTKTDLDAKRILVVGGAGYIGSYMVQLLKQAGYAPVILDNLSRGHAHAVKDAELIVGDMGDKAILDRLFSTKAISAVMHFASFIDVAESVRQPARYYQNNVVATLNLLDAMMRHDVKHFIFSSSAAVYGEPQYTPIDEAHPIAPINPYGRSKWMVEEIVKDYARSGKLNYAILRYFNAAGADSENKLGECHQPETHLIPLVLQVANEERESLTIYGNDYPTKDGTCVRDYVHIKDICDAHLRALGYLSEKEQSLICNLGSGSGYSVQEVVNVAQRVTDQKINIRYSARRVGDPAILVANANLANQLLNWQPQFSTLDVLIKDAWQFLQYTREKNAIFYSHLLN